MATRIKSAKRTVESLHHFSCTKCGKWWTIGDAPKSKKVWYCPWCGDKNNYEQQQRETIGN